MCSLNFSYASLLLPSVFCSAALKNSRHFDELLCVVSKFTSPFEKDAVHSTLNRLLFSLLTINACSGRMHLLCLKPELRKLLPGHDLYMFDKDSWSCMRGLLNLLADTHFANGFADRCLVADRNECRFAWTLYYCTPHYPSADNIVFHWCLIPPGFKQVLESYATCKHLHMGCVCGIPQAMDDSHYAQCFADVIKINLVMTLPTDLQFYTSICTSLSSYASTECSERVCRLPISTLREPESQITATSNWPCGSKDNFQTRAFPFSNTPTPCEEMCTSSDVLPTFPLAVADVFENDFNRVKTEPVANENGEEKMEDQTCYYAVPGTEPTLDTNVPKMLLFGNLLQIAKTFAALSNSEDSNYAFHPFPPHKVKGTRTIVECPGCNIPSSCNSSSAFVKLLCHVKRRHPVDCDVLLADIVERYTPLIKHMKRKIAKSKAQYPIRKGNKLSLSSPQIAPKCQP